MKALKNRKVLVWIIALFLAAILVWALMHGQKYLSRRSIGYTVRYINSFGAWAPAIVIALMTLSTLIPPLPLPVPLLEIATGLAFGFWGGVLVIWFAQVFSSVVAFVISRYLGRRILERVVENRIFNLYRNYLDKRGYQAVLLIRMAMAAPFNAISFIAGMTRMKVLNFLWATALGVIPETVLFTFLGSQLRSIKLNLGYVVLIIIGLGILSSGLTFLTMKCFLPRIMTSEKL